MAKHTDSIRRRNRYIEGLKSECLTEMSNDFDAIMDETVNLAITLPSTSDTLQGFDSLGSRHKILYTTT